MHSRALPTDSPSPIFCLGGGEGEGGLLEGAAVTRLSGTDDPVFKLSVEING